MARSIHAPSECGDLPGIDEFPRHIVQRELIAYIKQPAEVTVDSKYRRRQ